MSKEWLDDFYSFDFELLAVIAPVKEFKLAWEVEKLLEIPLVKEEDIILEFNNSSELKISNFLYQKEFGVIRLLKNKAAEVKGKTKPFLIPEAIQFDFFLLLEGTYIDDVEDITEGLEQLTTVVQFVKRIQIDQLKSKNNLLF